MIITFGRSSSFGSYLACPHKYLLQYVVKIPDEPHPKAVWGTVFHKVMECFAQASLALKNGSKTFVDEQFGELPCSAGANTFLQKSWNLYMGEDDPEAYKEIQKWIQKALTVNGGRWNPKNMDILYHEKFFDYEIPHDWVPT